MNEYHLAFFEDLDVFELASEASEAGIEVGGFQEIPGIELGELNFED